MTQQAYSIPEFLQVYRISRTKLYELWQQGKGPKSYTIGRKRLVSVDAAQSWQRQMEKEAS